MCDFKFPAFLCLSCHSSRSLLAIPLLFLSMARTFSEKKDAAAARLQKVAYRNAAARAKATAWYENQPAAPKLYTASMIAVYLRRLAGEMQDQSSQMRLCIEAAEIESLERLPDIVDSHPLPDADVAVMLGPVMDAAEQLAAANEQQARESALADAKAKARKAKAAASKSRQRAKIASIIGREGLAMVRALEQQATRSKAKAKREAAQGAAVQVIDPVHPPSSEPRPSAGEHRPRVLRRLRRLASDEAE